MQIIKNILASLFLLLLVNNGVGQVLEVDNSITPEQFVEMLVGGGVEVSNITFSGDPNQFGSFVQNGANIDMENGLLMGTGDVEFAEGPNDMGGGTLGGGFFDASDDDLDLLSNTNTNDAAILEFDFIATGDFLSFDYTFASEEYNEYVCANVNDAFGFFLSGPGISGIYSSPVGFPDGSINIALVPGTDIGVSIGTVNNGTVGEFGVLSFCDDLDPDWQSNNVYYIDNPQPAEAIQYDGFTTVLEASSVVQCGETYHIKLAIADGGDTAFDSGVFLEANSFNVHFTEIVASPTIDGSLYYNNDTILVEGCNTGMFEFIRGDTIGIDTIFFNLFGDIEASDLIDPLPDYVIFEEGMDTISLNVQAAFDNIDEDLEEFTLSYTYIQFCTGDTITTASTIWLQDQVPPLLSASNEEIYCADIVLEPTVTQGDGPFFWSWGILGDTAVINNESGQLVPFTDDIVETTYWVTIEDPCHYKDSINITVTPLPIPPLELSGDEVLVACPGDNTEVGFNIDSGANPVAWLWSTNSTAETINISPNGSTQVSVFATDGCGQTDSLTIAITVADPDGPLSLVMSNATTPCPGYSTSINVIANGGYNDEGYTYLWSTGSTENSISISPLEYGSNEYSVVVTDNCGFSTNGIGQVIVTAPPPMTLTTSEELCIGLTTVLTQDGGVDPIMLSTTIEVNVDVNNVVSGAVPGIGTITAQDICGQIVSTDITILGCETTIPNIFTPGSGNSVGFNDSFVIAGIENFPNSKLKIFNRWGNLVFESDNYNNTWKAENVSGGTYYYIFERVDGENFSGYIEVLK